MKDREHPPEKPERRPGEPAGTVLTAVENWLAAQGPAHYEPSEGGDMLRVLDNGAGWLISICEDKGAPQEYLYSFDAAMDALIREQASTAASVKLAAAVAFASTMRKDDLSYRKALKKYSRSIIFPDLGIHLLLLHAHGGLEVITPEKVNAFLQNLNRHILSSNPKFGADHHS